MGIKEIKVRDHQIYKSVEVILGNPKTMTVTDKSSCTRRAVKLIINEGKDFSSCNDKVILHTALKLNLPIQHMMKSYKSKQKN